MLEVDTNTMDMESSLRRQSVDYDYSSSPPSAASTPIKSARSAEEAFQRSLVGMLNKRGYNVQDSGTFSFGNILNDNSETLTESLTSTTSSSMSSLILSLREPNHGQGPLHIAVRKGDLQVLEALLENECVDEIVNLEDNNGNTALHFAAGSWRRPQCAMMVEGLLYAGAQVNIKNARGLTALAVHMLTMKVDNPTVVIKLLDYGSDPNTEVDGESLLHIAIKRNLPNICGALVSFGASMQALNSAGLMCYEVASPLIKRAMLRHLEAAPPFLPTTLRSKCMRCNGPLLSAKKTVGNFFKRCVGAKVSNHQCNCYICGLLFCSQCLKRTQIADALGPQFSRCRLDDLSNVKTCPYCESVLLERRQKIQAKERRQSLLRMHSSTSAA